MENKFRLLVNDTLLNFVRAGEEQFQKKHVLSYLNDFENDEWRYEHFIDFIFDSLCETALSAVERGKLATEPISALKKAAKNLRLSGDSGKGSELAEIFLYGIMRQHYRALPAIPKIFYKQNSQDNAKGADSVHIVLGEDDKFSLWYGESKFYTKIEDAIQKAISSVKDTITDNKLRKENSILTSTREIDDLVEDKKKLDRIKTMLSSDTSLDRLKSILHIPILLLHECEITASQQQWSKAYCAKIEQQYQSKAQSFFSKLDKECVGVHFYAEITFHLILFPVPSKEKVVRCFTEQAQSLRKQNQS